MSQNKLSKEEKENLHTLFQSSDETNQELAKCIIENRLELNVRENVLLLMVEAWLYVNSQGQNNGHKRYVDLLILDCKKLEIEDVPKFLDLLPHKRAVVYETQIKLEFDHIESLGTNWLCGTNVEGEFDFQAIADRPNNYVLTTLNLKHDLESKHNVKVVSYTHTWGKGSSNHKLILSTER